MEVHRRAGSVPIRTVSIIGGMIGNSRSLGTFAKGVETLAMAVLGRVCRYEVKGEYLLPLPCLVDPRIELLGFKRRLLATYGERLPPVTREEFVQMYKGRKKTIYDQAVMSLEFDKINKMDAKLKAFVKCEKVKVTSCPRVIQPRSPRYNVEVGVYIKPIEHRIYRAIARTFHQKCVVAKGLNVLQLGTIVRDLWDSVSDCVFIGLDAHRFDMHCTVKMLSWEHSVYQALYPQSKELRRLLGWQLLTRGVGYCEDGMVKYSVQGRRCSGDMNTALGNCLIMCAMFYRYKQLTKIPFKLINNGDDCGVFLERRDVNRFIIGVESFFGNYGFRMECEKPVCEMEGIRFCQMAPLMVGKTCRMVRELNTSREKDSISIVKFTNSTFMRKWIYAVGLGGLALCSGVPVMQSFYGAYIRSGIASRMNEATYMECGAQILAKGLESQREPIEHITRASFYAAFDLTPFEQMVLEQYYDNLSIDYGERVTALSDVTPSGLY